MRSPWRLLAISAIPALGLLASPVLAQLCLVDPISPLCCPSPCPVFDAARVPKLLADVETLGNAIVVDAQIVKATAQVGQSIGDATAVASAVSRQMSNFAGTLSGEVTTTQTALPANPDQALASLKQSLFEPVGVASTATQLTARRSARMAAAQEEQIAALATSLMRSKALPTLASQQSQIAGTVRDAQQLQGDMAANSASRLALYQDVGALHQLVAAWVAQRSVQAALKQPSGIGETLAPTAPPPTNSPVPATPAPADQPTAGMVDTLIALHDARVAARSLTSAYPGLQQTVASASLANQFATQAEIALQRSLSNAGISTVSLPDVENTLTALDTTSWLENAKAAAAQQAAAKVSAALLAGSGRPQIAADQEAVQQVQAAMVAWLDAKKQSLYWAGLANQAQQSMSALDASLGTLSDRVGVDVTGTAGAAQEKALLAQLSLNPGIGRWAPLLAVAAHDPSARSVLNYMGAQ